MSKVYQEILEKLKENEAVSLETVIPGEKGELT